VLAETGAESLTGRRLLKALKHIKGDTFLATYGDAVADVDIDQLLHTHRQMGKLATVTAVHPSSRFGELAIDGQVIRSFAEKPQVTDGWINGGFFVVERKAFDYLPDENVAFETGLLEKLTAMEQLAVYRHHGFWQCMDTFREMQLLNDMWQEGRAPWRTWH
jgi:glucose-1-phosphate cytidylyltransferase